MSNEQDKDKSKPRIDVTVDTSRTEALARENERLKMEKEKREGKTTFDVNEKKLDMFEKTKDPRYLQCKTMDEVKDLTTTLMSEVVERKKGTPSGSAPLNSAQTGEKSFDLYTHKWEGNSEAEKNKAMTDFLYAHYKDDTPLGKECNGYLEEMLKKWAYEFRQKKDQRFYDPNVREHLPALKEYHGFQVAENPNEADIKRVLEKWRMQNPRIRKAMEQINAGANPQSKEN